MALEVTGPIGADGEPRPSVTVRLLPGEALELAALLTRSTRKLEKRQG